MANHVKLSQHYIILLSQAKGKYVWFSEEKINLSVCSNNENTVIC